MVGLVQGKLIFSVIGAQNPNMCQNPKAQIG